MSEAIPHGVAGRVALERREAAVLHPLAQRASASRGRRVPEPPHAYRTEFQRDRDRVLHAAAFRRLEAKTQVFHPDAPGEFRTRLTHTLEVAQTARVIGRALGFHEDLIEAVAYAHDLGHPPFGHAGEAVLDRLMREQAGLPATEEDAEVCAGFNHNVQALRVVDVLERRYPNVPGLNLTFETRAALLKHGCAYADCGPADVAALLAFSGDAGSVEARIVDLADRLAYLCHDFEDALFTGVLTYDEVAALPLLGRLALSRGAVADVEQRVYLLVRDLKNEIVTDLLRHSAAQLAALGDDEPQPQPQPQPQPATALGYSPETAAAIEQAHAFLVTNYYTHERVDAHLHTMTERLEAVYRYLLAHPELLPSRFVAHVQQHGPVSEARLVCDWVASLTDRRLAEIYEQRA